MKTYLLAIICMLGFGWAAADHRNPVAEVSLVLSSQQQVLLFEATAAFGRSHGFIVTSSNDLPRDGRLVRQLMLENSKGTMIVLQNFMDTGQVVTHFFAGSDEADWRAARQGWEAMREQPTHP